MVTFSQNGNFLPKTATFFLPTVTFYLKTVTFNQNGNFIPASLSGICGDSVPASVGVSALFLLLWSDDLDRVMTNPTL